MDIISDLLVKLFIKNYKETNRHEVRLKYGLLEGYVSIAINALLFAVKLTLGLWVNSISLLADAAHTFSDIISSIVVILGCKISSAPADGEHPFGHGRMEYIATLIIAILLILTGLEFLKATVLKLFDPKPVIFSLPVIGIFILTIAVKEWSSRFSYSLGKCIDSSILIGDACHHRSDVITSIVVLLPLVSEKLNLIYLDGIVGIIVSLYILYIGWKMAYNVISPLLGEAPTFKELSKIRGIAMSADKILGVHDIVLHKYGQVKIISLHAEVSEDMPFSEGHELIEFIEQKLNREMNATTVIHIDPVQKMTDELKKVYDVLEELTLKNSQIDSYHDVRIVRLKKKATLLIDIVAKREIGIDQIRVLKKEIARRLQSSFPSYVVKVWVEPKFHMT